MLRNNFSDIRPISTHMRPIIGHGTPSGRIFGMHSPFRVCNDWTGRFHCKLCFTIKAHDYWMIQKPLRSRPHASDQTQNFCIEGKRALT